MHAKLRAFVDFATNANAGVVAVLEVAGDVAKNRLTRWIDAVDFDAVLEGLEGSKNRLGFRGF